MTSEVVWRPLWPQAVMASEAVGDNMHINTRVIKFADVESEVI